MTVWEHWVTIYTRLKVLTDWHTALLLIDDRKSTDPAPEYDDAFRVPEHLTMSGFAG